MNMNSTTLIPPFNEIYNISADTLEEAKVQARVKYIDMTFLDKSNQNIYNGKLLKDLENQHTQGYNGVFPINIIEAYRIINYWR